MDSEESERRIVEARMRLRERWRARVLATRIGFARRPLTWSVMATITPQLYAWKGAKWICRLEFVSMDRFGYYSNTAHPWQDDRYSQEGGDLPHKVEHSPTGWPPSWG